MCMHIPPPTHTHTCTHIHVIVHTSPLTPVYLCTHTHTQTCMYMCTHAHTHVHVHTHTHIHMYKHTYVHVMHTRMHVHAGVYMCTCTCVCMSAHACTCMHMQTHAHAHTLTLAQGWKHNSVDGLSNTIHIKTFVVTSWAPPCLSGCLSLCQVPWTPGQVQWTPAYQGEVQNGHLHVSVVSLLSARCHEHLAGCNEHLLDLGEVKLGTTSLWFPSLCQVQWTPGQVQWTPAWSRWSTSWAPPCLSGFPSLCQVQWTHGQVQWTPAWSRWSQARHLHVLEVSPTRCHEHLARCNEPLPDQGGVTLGTTSQWFPHTPSIAFQHLPPNSARTGYAAEGELFISLHSCPPTQSASSKRFGCE